MISATNHCVFFWWCACFVITYLGFRFWIVLLILLHVVFTGNLTRFFFFVASMLFGDCLYDYLEVKPDLWVVAYIEGFDLKFWLFWDIRSKDGFKFFFPASLRFHVLAYVCLQCEFESESCLICYPSACFYCIESFLVIFLGFRFLNCDSFIVVCDSHWSMIRVNV